MELIETLIFVTPIILTSFFSLINGISFFRLFKQKADFTLFHISVIFFSMGIMFIFFIIPFFFPVILSLECFLLANVVVWIIFLEIGNAYFNAFLNCINAYERYTLPIFGGAIAFALFTAINPDIYLLVNPFRIEAFLYIAGFISVMYLLLMSFNRVNLILTYFEGEELRMLELTQRVFWIGALCLIYTFFSVVTWLIVKGIDKLSLDVPTWELIDWLVYSNVIIYFGLFLGAFIYSKKIDWGKIDIPSLLNILDSPSSL
ncbi:MAG: hypothetical protein ACTSR4_07890 [Candidatus Hodarchaeales archaeon]